MYCIIDDTNRVLPHHITEEDYLLLPLSKQLLYQLYGEDDRNFIAGDGEPTDDNNNAASFDLNDIESPPESSEDQFFI